MYDLEELHGRFSPKVLDRRGFNMWRYIELLPISSRRNIVSLGEGGTFLHKADKLANKLGLRRLSIKDETTNPTGSYMDRGSSILISALIEMDYSSVTGAVGGNLGASISAYAAKSGMKSRLFIPKGIDLGKLYQILAYGSELHVVKDMKEAKKRAGLARIGGDDYLIEEGDPFINEGKKTIFWEIVEQLEWKLPDWVIVPMASGGLLSMLYKAYKEMVGLGLIEGDFRMVGVQPVGSSPIVNAFNSSSSHDEKESLVYDLSASSPLFLDPALKAIKETKGLALVVSDDEMFQSARRLAKTEGIFAEPAAASTVAALNKLVSERMIGRNDSVVCVITGSGLKDPKSIQWEGLGRRRRATELEHVEGTKKLILQILADRELHGYEIWKGLRERGVDVSLPSVYQHLQDLFESGLVYMVGVTKVKGRRRTVYGLSSRGITLALS
jgi:threonine synthase